MHHVEHLLQRRGDDGAAGLGAAEEGLLVDLGGGAGVADEDDVHLAVVARQEHVQQHEEALGEVLQRLGHGGRRVHQAEHHGLRGGLRHPLEAVVLQVDGIDVGDGAPQPLLMLELGAQRGDFRLVGGVFRLRRRQFLLELLDLGKARPPQRQAAPQALAHGARVVEPRRRAVGCEARARRLGRLQVLELHLDQVRQLQVVEEQIEELVLREREGELILAFAVGTALAAASAASALRLGYLVADLVLLVAGKHVVAQPVLRPMENDGSRRLLERMVTFSEPSASDTLRFFSESLMASRISALARRRNLCRLPRLLDLGFSRRSTICMGFRERCRASLQYTRTPCLQSVAGTARDQVPRLWAARGR